MSNQKQLKFTSPAQLSGMPEDTPVLVAFSGGADSTSLLHMLTQNARQTGARIYAAHVNHMIRGAEADRDEEFCRKTAEELGIQIFVCRKDVPAYAKERGESIETTARNVRYEFFDSIMREHSIPLLATAHNANDNLETMIFNMIRGCGLTGMCGIPQTRSCSYGTVVRPILSMSREEILQYCEENKLSYVTDSTNIDTDYTRNKIRHEIIPSLMSINSAAVENSARLSRSLRDDSMCLISMADWFLEELNEDASIETEKLLGSPAAIANRAIMSLYHDVSDGKSLEAVHIDAVRALCADAVPHSAIDLPNGIVAKIESKRLYIEKKTEKLKASPQFSQTLCQGENFISEINAQIIIGNSQNAKNIYKNSILLYFDSAKICGNLVARDRRPQDKIKVGGMNKNVKKLLCDKKIPLDIRYRLPIICDDNGIVAIPFTAVRDGMTARDKTNALQVQIILN